MRLRTAFILFNYLLAALGLACLAFGEIFSSLSSLFIFSALGICLFLELNKTLPLQPTFQFSLIKAGAVGLPLIYFGFAPPLLDLIAWFLVFILITRFIFKTELNDYLYGYLVAIVCLLVGAIFIRDLVFAVIFLSFYLVLSWSLILYNLMVERAGSQSPPEKFKTVGETETAGGSLLGLSGALVLMSLLMTTAIFVSFPRIGLGFLAIQTPASPISGFSENVQLGDVGKIKLNQSVVMRVEYTRDGEKYHPKSKVLWRGVTLDHYDGKTWTSTMPIDWRARNRPGRGISLFTLDAPKEVVQQEVFVETFDSSVIFTHGITMSIDGSFTRLTMDRSFALRTMDNRIGPKRFIMKSDIGSPEASFNSQIPMPRKGNFLEKSLQLPVLSDDIRNLAAKITQESTAETEKADSILSYLLDNFGYSLDLVSETGSSSGLDEFLFTHKKGHCEYFASAMVILLRLNGIPARIVNGFVGSEWNDLGHYMIVRQAHAHSWVEAWHPEKGWMIYDPTPPDPTVVSSQNAMSRSLDLMRLYWQRYVVKYSIQDQIKILQFFNNERKDIREAFKSLKSGEIKVAVQYLKKHRIAIGAIILLLLILLQKKYREYSLSPPQPFPVRIYNQMLGRLEKAGIKKESFWTHNEFLEHVPSDPQERKAIVARVTEFYEKSRFGASRISKSEKQKMRDLVRQI